MTRLSAALVKAVGVFKVDIPDPSQSARIAKDIDVLFENSDNPTKSESVDGNGDPLPAVNNGDYSAFSHVVSLGVEVNFEAFFRDRKPKFGDAEYEDLDTGDKPKARPKKDDEKEGAGAVPQKTYAVTGVRKPAPEQVDPPGTWWKPGVPYSQLKDSAPGAAEDTESPPPRKKREVR